MPRYLILIDDGELIASDAATSFVSMDAAFEATIQAAYLIAAERASWTHAHQRLACEVQQRGSDQRREFDVLLRIDHH